MNEPQRIKSPRPGFVCQVQTRRDERDLEAPRILLHAGKDVDAAVLRAYALRLQADIEEASPPDLWTTTIDYGATPTSIFGAIELRMLRADGAALERGLELLRRACDVWNRVRTST